MRLFDRRLFDRRRLTCRALAFGLAAGLTSLAGAARAESEMSFRTVQLGDHGYAISAHGQITNETPDRFVEFLNETPELRGRHPVVLLDSPGGRVLASMEFGKVLRQVGASAIVAGVSGDGEGGVTLTNAQCFSACVYALMGASKRVIPSSSMIGIHRMFAYEADVDASGDETVHRRYDDGRMRGYLQQYSSAMGVSPGLISAAEHIASDHLKILSRSEIRRYHLGATR